VAELQTPDRSARTATRLNTTPLSLVYFRPPTARARARPPALFSNILEHMRRYNRPTYILSVTYLFGC